ncbi:hypothetical protein GC197_06975 [bacterium]|nr:hypothetical protein [bacterium]
MTTDSTNPFASPKADVEATSVPEADQVYPLQATAMANIEEVPEPYAGTVRTLGARFFNGLIYVTVVFAVVVTFYMLIIYGPEMMNLGGYASVALIIGSIAVQYGLFQVIHVLLKDRWWEAVARRRFLDRPSAWVDSHSYRSQYVTLTSTQPKAMSSFQLGSNEAEILDVGLMELDQTAGQIVLECEFRRYRIPRASLLACNLQQITLGTPWTPVVRLVCQTKDGPYEFCLLPSETDPLKVFTMRNRKKRAELLVLEILGLPS